MPLPARIIHAQPFLRQTSVELPPPSFPDKPSRRDRNRQVPPHGFPSTGASLKSVPVCFCIVHSRAPRLAFLFIKGVKIGRFPFRAIHQRMACSPLKLDYKLRSNISSGLYGCVKRNGRGSPVEFSRATHSQQGESAFHVFPP